MSDGVSSPSLDALMPFVPLMFRRDLLLPEPTFSGMQVSSRNLPRLQIRLHQVSVCNVQRFALA